MSTLTSKQLLDLADSVISINDIRPAEDLLTGWPTVNFAKARIGFKPGELSMWVGRSTGKSTFMQWAQQYKTAAERDNMFTKIDIKPAYKGEFKIEVPWARIVAVEEWCQATLGDPGRSRRHSWRKNNVRYGVYFLRNEADALLFRLKWM